MWNQLVFTSITYFAGQKDNLMLILRQNSLICEVAIDAHLESLSKLFMPGGTSGALHRSSQNTAWSAIALSRTSLGLTSCFHIWSLFSTTLP